MTNLWSTKWDIQYQMGKYMRAFTKIKNKTRMSTFSILTQCTT